MEKDFVKKLNIYANIIEWNSCAKISKQNSDNDVEQTSFGLKITSSIFTTESTDPSHVSLIILILMQILLKNP